MENKCDKYEAMFVFSSEDDFQKHLEECPECFEEQQKMNRISALVKEAAPAYYAREHSLRYKKIVSCCALLVFALVSIVGYSANFRNSDTSKYQVSSVISDMGLPVDDYGLLKM